MDYKYSEIVVENGKPANAKAKLLQTFKIHVTNTKIAHSLNCQYNLK